MSIGATLRAKCEQVAEQGRNEQAESQTVVIGEESHVIDKVKITCDQHVKTHVQKVIPIDEYKKLAVQLESWNVVYRGYVLKNYPLEVVKEAIARTKFKEKNLNNPGAYFNKVIRSLNKI